MKDSNFYNQVELLVSLLPIIAEQPIFALKGGTAINLFLREMPRLSVDIDLTYLPLESREKSIKQISIGLKYIKEKIEGLHKDIKVSGIQRSGIGEETTLNVQSNKGVIKIETNFVVRGSVYPPEIHDLCESA